MAQTLFLSVVLGLLTAFVYGAVGNRVGSRSLQGEAAIANRMFSLWWWALALITGMAAAINLAAAVGLTFVRLHIFLMYVLLFALCVSLWALGYYLLYLFTGRRTILIPLGLFYLAYYVFIAYLVAHAHPIGVEVGLWNAGLTYEREFLAGHADTWILLLLVAPQVVGGVAYFSLYFRVDNRSQKYRIAMVAGTIVVWFGSSILASATGLNEVYAWPIVSRLIGLTAALLIYSAFKPPRWMQRRFGLEPVAIVTPTTLGPDVGIRYQPPRPAAPAPRIPAVL